MRSQSYGSIVLEGLHWSLPLFLSVGVEKLVEVYRNKPNFADAEAQEDVRNRLRTVSAQCDWYESLHSIQLPVWAHFESLHSIHLVSREPVTKLLFLIDSRGLPLRSSCVIHLCSLCVVQVTSMLNYLEASRWKLSCALAELTGQVKPSSKYSPHIEKSKDKQVCGSLQDNSKGFHSQQLWRFRPKFQAMTFSFQVTKKDL